MRLETREVQGDDVVDDEQTEAGEVEEVAEEDGGGDHGGKGVPTEAVEVPGDQSDETHGDGSANAVAAGGDEHAEFRGKHEAHLVGREGLAEEMGEAAGDVGGGVLQGEVDEDVEDVGDGVDEPEQSEGKE